MMRSAMQVLAAAIAGAAITAGLILLGTWRADEMRPGPASVAPASTAATR